MPGGRIDIAVDIDAKNVPAKLEQSLKPAVDKANKIGKFIGLSLGAATVAVGFKEVIKIGNDFTTSLNTLQAVSSATEAQMAAVSARAKELGNDITLPGTSASDAAAAMTELAKGGFTVEQSMAAAKGTLQLAAAAQISAAQAATIQSQALQAFGKDATFAATAADVLANTANASSAEMTDVAAGLQQAGTVANQFGVSMEDTAATIGLFANAGIVGSDAGTLMKSALLALTDQGKPAQAAIEELGLTVYDAQGKFVGMHELFGQLDTAAASMTDEQYQAATATLFGSDAMRLAGVAAEVGAAGYDKMRDAIGKQGSAAEVANAKMQGLPGAMAAAQNAAENLALEVYDLVDGPLESFATSAASAVTSATPVIVGGLETVGGAVSTVASAFMALPGPVKAAAVALAAIKVTGLDDFAANMSGKVTGSMRSFNDEMKLQQQLASMSGQEVGRLSAATATLSARVPAIASMGEAYRNVSTRTGEFAASQKMAGVASGGLSGQLRLAAGSATNFAGIVGGTAAASVNGMKSAIGGVTSALGGPWVIGIAAAAGVVTQLISASGRATQVMDTQRRAAEGVAKANDDMYKALSESNGLVNDSVLSIVTGKVEALRTSSQQMADSAPGIWGKLAAGISGGWDMIDGSMDGTAIESTITADKLSADGGRIVEAMNKTGLSSTELGKIVTGDSSKFLDFSQSLTRAGGASGDLAVAMQNQRAEFINAQQSATQVKSAIEQIEQKAIGAAGGVDQLTGAMGRLREDGRTAESAQKALTLALDGLRQSASNGGMAVVDAAGKIDLSTTAGVRLDDQMGRVASAWDQAGAAARTAATEQELSAQDTEVAVAAAQQRVRDEFIATATQSGLTQTQAEGLANLFLNWPPTAKTTIELDDAHAREVMNKFIADNQGAQIQVQLIGTLANGSTPGVPQTVVPDDLAGLMGQPQRRALGGAVTGGTPGVDSVPALLMPKEHVLTTEDVDALGGQDGTYRFRAALQAGLIGKFAVGGAAGQSAAQRAGAFLRAESGKDYQYGGVGNPSWDCSGYASAGYAQVKGLDPHTRWFTTESDFAALGFRRGLDPSGQGLSFGVHNGGGGQYSHMAGFLGRIPFESGSNGVRFGAGAAGASDGQFENKWYLPTSAFNPPGGASQSARSAPTTPSAGGDLEMRSAQLAVRQAQAARDEALADATKSPDDKEQAQISLERAQERVAELESKKSTTDSVVDTGPAPQAPDLTGSMTDEQIRLRELERSITKANEDRNEVYADSTRTTDREDADLALQRARNALAAEQEKQAEDLRGGGQGGSGGSDGGSVVELFGNAAKAAVEGQLSDALNVVGIGGNIGGAVGAAITQSANYKPAQSAQNAPSFSKDDLSKQGPVTPGTPGWFEGLLKTLTVPAVLRDSGGPLKHGTAALNLSGDTEWVQTGGQRQQYERDMKELAALRATGTGGAQVGPGFEALADEVRKLASRPNVSYTLNTRDVEENERRIRQINQLNALGAGSRF